MPTDPWKQTPKSQVPGTRYQPTAPKPGKTGERKGKKKKKKKKKKGKEQVYLASFKPISALGTQQSRQGIGNSHMAQITKSKKLRGSDNFPK
jgi:hypothetical protein